MKRILLVLFFCFLFSGRLLEASSNGNDSNASGSFERFDQETGLGSIAEMAGGTAARVAFQQAVHEHLTRFEPSYDGRYGLGPGPSMGFLAGSFVDGSREPIYWDDYCLWINNDHPCCKPIDPKLCKPCKRVMFNNSPCFLQFEPGKGYYSDDLNSEPEERGSTSSSANMSSVPRPDSNVNSWLRGEKGLSLDVFGAKASEIEELRTKYLVLRQNKPKAYKEAGLLLEDFSIKRDAAVERGVGRGIILVAEGLRDQGVISVDEGDVEEGIGFIARGIQILDVAMDFTPGVGWAKDCIQAISGVNPITGQKLSTFDRSAALIGAVTVGFGSKFLKGFKAITKYLKPNSAIVQRSMLVLVSKAATQAASKISSWVPKNKHLLSGGSQSKARFTTDSIKEVQELVLKGLKSENAKFLPNPNIKGTFRTIVDAGKVIGVKGQRNIRIIVGQDGKVINAFPVHNL